MSDTNEELHRQIVYIAEMVEAAADGKLYKVDGENTIISDIDEWKEKEYEKKVKEFKDSHDSYDPDSTIRTRSTWRTRSVPPMTLTNPSPCPFTNILKKTLSEISALRWTPERNS